jgi:hypothetical protein
MTFGDEPGSSPLHASGYLDSLTAGRVSSSGGGGAR